MLKWLLSAPLLPCNVCAKIWPAGTRLQASLFPQLGKPAQCRAVAEVGQRTCRAAAGIGQRTDSAPGLLASAGHPSLHPARPQDAPRLQHLDRLVEATGNRVRHAAAFQLGGELLLCRRQPASCCALDLHPAMLAVWRDEQQVERARANAQARQQCRRGGASVLTIGNVQPDPVLPRGATQQVGDGTVHAPLDRRRRPAATTWERQRELVGGSHGEKTRGHLPSSGGAPRTNWIQKYNCFAIETTGRADEHHRYPREDRVSSGHDVRFRIPRDVATAASAVAQRELISLSDVARRALVADLRNRGLLRRGRYQGVHVQSRRRQAETGRGAPELNHENTS